MKKMTMFYLVGWMAVVSVWGQSSHQLRYEIMLSKDMIATSHNKEIFIRSIDISPGKFITLASPGRFYQLGWGGMSELGQKPDSQISGFCFTFDGLMMAVKNRSLCYMDSLGKLQTLLILPTSGMGIAPGKEVVYLFDQNRTDSHYRLYAYAKHGKYKTLLASPKPVVSVVEMNGLVYMAIGSAVFSFSPQNNAVNLEAGFQKENEITSLAVDSDHDILYAATRDAIFALKNESLVYVTGDFGGGIIKYFQDGLVIFNPDTNDIIRIVNLHSSLLF